MFITCNCTLPYSNPEVCKNCNVNPMDTWNSLDYLLTYNNTNMNLYNPETHDLVEKKGAKIERLNEELEVLMSTIEAQESLIDEKSRRILELREEKQKIINELVELKTD